MSENFAQVFLIEGAKSCDETFVTIFLCAFKNLLGILIADLRNTFILPKSVHFLSGKFV